MTGTGMNQTSGSHWLASRPGTATDQQAGLALFDLQQTAFFGLGEDRLDHMLAFGQRRHL
ncbi:hypothetical protein D3C72_2392320 [compost metagenome]